MNEVILIDDQSAALARQSWNSIDESSQRPQGFARLTDEQLIINWLRAGSKSENTRGAYAYDVRLFLAFVDKPLCDVTVSDVQDWADTLTGADASVGRRIATIKSLFRYAQRNFHVRYNVAEFIEAPRLREKLVERILSKEEVLRMIHFTDNPRDALLLRMMYATGARVSEICALRWADVRPNGTSGQVTFFGKGRKTRHVKLSDATWKMLVASRPADADVAVATTGFAGDNTPVFCARHGGELTRGWVHAIVKAAARRAKVNGQTSPHWFRHAHASHALDAGANVALVQSTLGHKSLDTTTQYVHVKPTDSSALYLDV